MSKQIKVEYIDTSSTYAPRDMGLPPISKMSEESQKYLEWATHMTAEAGEANSVQYLQTAVLLMPEFNELLEERVEKKGLFSQPRLDRNDFYNITTTLAQAFALNLFTYDGEKKRLELDTSTLKDQYTMVEIDGKRYDREDMMSKISRLSSLLINAIGDRLTRDIIPVKSERDSLRMGKHLAYLLAMATMHREAIEELDEV